MLKSALQAELQRSQVDDPALAAFKDTVQALVASFEEAAKLYRRSIVIRRGMPGIKEAFPTTTTEEEARAVGGPAGMGRMMGAYCCSCVTGVSMCVWCERCEGVAYRRTMMCAGVAYRQTVMCARQRSCMTPCLRAP